MANLNFMKRAGEDAVKHRMSFSNPFKAAWDARDPYPPLRYQKGGQPVQTMLLSELTPVLVHTVNSSWSKQGPYANRENVRCTYWGFDDEGKWIPRVGGHSCIQCKALGRDPKFGLLGMALDNQPYFNKRKNQLFQNYPKRVEIYDDAVRGMIISMVERFAAQYNRQPSPRGALFSVMRSNKDKSPAHGDIWTFEKFVDEPMVAFYKDWIPNWDLLFPYYDDATLLEMLKRHKDVCDKHGLNAFSADGMAAIGVGSAPSTADPQAQGKIFTMPPNQPQAQPAFSQPSPSQPAPSQPVMAPVQSGPFGAPQTQAVNQQSGPFGATQTQPTQSGPFGAPQTQAAPAPSFAQAAPPPQNQAVPPPQNQAALAQARAASGSAPWDGQPPQAQPASTPFGASTTQAQGTPPKLDDLDDVGGDDDFDPYNQ